MVDSHNGIHKERNLEALVILQAIFLILKLLDTSVGVLHNSRVTMTQVK